MRFPLGVKMQDPLDPHVTKILAMRGEPDTAEAHARLSQEINDAIDQAILEALPLQQLDKLEAAAANNTVTEDLVEHLLAEAHIDSKAIIDSVLQKYQNDTQKGVENE